MERDMQQGLRRRATLQGRQPSEPGSYVMHVSADGPAPGLYLATARRLGGGREGGGTGHLCSRNGGEGDAGGAEGRGRAGGRDDRSTVESLVAGQISHQRDDGILVVGSLLREAEIGRDALAAADPARHAHASAHGQARLLESSRSAPRNNNALALHLQCPSQLHAWRTGDVSDRSPMLQCCRGRPLPACVFSPSMSSALWPRLCSLVPSESLIHPRANPDAIPRKGQTYHHSNSSLPLQLCPPRSFVGQQHPRRHCSHLDPLSAAGPCRSAVSHTIRGLPSRRRVF